ncbi:hypothetical protein HWV62_9889 [Athelia sp. TMB]|nr:hypothetical protein HWV62_9889 [Athelia sp. TMB]
MECQDMQQDSVKTFTVTQAVNAPTVTVAARSWGHNTNKQVKAIATAHIGVVEVGTLGSLLSMLVRLGQRMTSRLGASYTFSLARTHVGAHSSFISARRSFLTSIPHPEPAAAGTPKKASADKETAVKKVETEDETSVKPKRKVAAKKSAAKTVAKKPKVEKPTYLKLTKEDMPPKGPGNAYPFVDDFERARALYQIERQAYFDKVPSATLKEINRRRVKRGLPKIRRPQNDVKDAPAKPLSSFFLFAADFRKSEEAAEIRRTSPPGLPTSSSIARAAGVRWKEMDEAAKAPYLAATKKEREAYNATKEAAATSDS